jgi:formylglycine-generating enzyme required for sulfatase activity
MAAKVFISYRREDSAGYAGRVYDRLEREFGRDRVVMDVDAIPLGADFVKVIGEEVGKCDVLLAIIGSGWLDACDEDGNRRLENPADFVRIEIATALTRDIPVIPILLDGTRIPRADRLTDDLKKLSVRNALNVRHDSFARDMEKLINELRRVQSPQQPQPTAPSLVDRYRAEGRIKVDAAIIHDAPEGWFLPGNGKSEWFRDHEMGPEMVVVPAGKFVMGSPDSEPERSDNEGPQHPVTIARPFAVGRHAVTRGQFAAFVNNTGYKTEGGAWVWTDKEWKKDLKASWRNPGFIQDDSHPVICVSWDDAKNFATWLSSQSGRDYRLLTEAEWEYAARAGTTTPFWWGSAITSVQANYDGTYVYKGGGAKGEYRKQTVAAGEFAANPWGLYQVHGNVWEWCEDVWHKNYKGAPSDGSAWLQGGNEKTHVVRGGSWSANPRFLRSANRNRITTGSRDVIIGFRVGGTLTA